MFKKALKYLRVIPIDVFVYSITKDSLVTFEDIGYKIQKENINENKEKFFIVDNGRIIHQSFLFKKLFLLRIINKKGPAIGECATISEYKGKSIYPFVINYIAHEELLNNRHEEVFIIVNSNNVSSIKGIEKAGFKLHTKIKAKRFLVFHFAVQRSKN
ncbi:MAG: hypothetical protein M0D53_02810 [Flavobacterium sp. JAD_PAG50586_2]|nr:MAG: hypothetical protein M0D53_02810 [Flavobacterium sp. JAD_PAG50586_2]